MPITVGSKLYGYVLSWVASPSSRCAAAQGGAAAEGTCPLCRADVNLAKIFSPAQLQPLEPAPEPDLEPDEQPEEPFVSSTKLDTCAERLAQSLQ